MRGYIRKRGNGYRVEIHVGYCPETGKRRRHMKTLPTKKLAQRYLREKIEELETEGTIRTRSLETLEQFLERWLQICAKQRVRQRTFEDYQWAIGRYFVGTPLGSRTLGTITPADIQERYGAILSSGTGPHGVRKAHSVLRQALQQAVRWRVLGVNPAAAVDLPRIKRKPELRILPVSDFPRFVESALQEQRLGALWVLALATGMRPEEYLGLQWPDFGPEFRKVTINRALVRPLFVKEGEPRWRFEDPKTEKSRRTLALEPEMGLILKGHRAQQNGERLAAGPAYEDHGLVFANELGGPLHSNNLRKRVLKRILRRAGLADKLTLYSLRHSAATALLKDRESLKVVSSMLGHSTIRLTADIYAHVTDDMLEEASAKLGRRLFGGP